MIEVEDLLRDYQRIVNIRPGGIPETFKGLNIVTIRSYTLMRISTSPTWIAAIFLSSYGFRRYDVV